MARTVKAQIESVVQASSCSGCGGCAVLSKVIRMELDPAGWARPVWDGPDVVDVVDAAIAESFRSICPGIGVSAVPPAGRRSRPTMGECVLVWRAGSNDPKMRAAGSGEVLTAFASRMLYGGQVTSLVGAVASSPAPRRTRTIQVHSRKDAIATAGSRHAPVSNAANATPTDSRVGFIGKPCAVYAIHAITGRRGVQRPILMPFFCAGALSQTATYELITQLGVDLENVTGLRHRGNGWPGTFRAEDAHGKNGALSGQSWGDRLGKQLQDGRKICPAGPAGHADIAVDDPWLADEDWNLLFDDGPGVSVAVARADRGHELLEQARRAGVLTVESVDLPRVARVQPFQKMRRETLFEWPVGPRPGGKPIPRYRDFHLVRANARDPKQSLHAARGSLRRVRAERRLST